MKITNDAEREFSHSAELANYRRVLVTSIVNGEPIVGTVLRSRSDFLHRARHEILAPVGGKEASVTLNDAVGVDKKGDKEALKLLKESPKRLVANIYKSFFVFKILLSVTFFSFPLLIDARRSATIEN